MSMRYVSTRGEASAANFEEVLLSGLAPDGGLYLPECWPQITPEEIAGNFGGAYAEAAAEIVSCFTGNSFTQDRLKALSAAAYNSFYADKVAPVTSLGGEDWLLELYHGPTLAFKDFAMQLLGQAV